MGFNSPEWFIADLAAVFANGLAVGIYATNSPEMCKYMATHSKANIIVVEDERQLDKILLIKNDLKGNKPVFGKDLMVIIVFARLESYCAVHRKAHQGGSLELARSYGDGD